MKKLKPSFKKQLKKILKAYQEGRLCPICIPDAFPSILLNDRTEWILGIQVQPGISFKDIIRPSSEELSKMDPLDIFMHAAKTAEDFNLTQDSNNKGFWEHGGCFVPELESDTALYMGGLVVHNESRGRYTLGDIANLQNTFVRSCIMNTTDETDVEIALYNAVKETLAVLSSIHASQGEDVFAFEFDQRVVN